MTTLLRPSQRVVAVTGANTLIVPANPNRLGLILSNSDLNSPIWLGINVPAVIGQGILLSGNTRPDVWSEYTVGGTPRGQISAIATLLGAPAGAGSPQSAIGQGLSGAALATVLTLTVPAGSSGILQSATVANFNLAPTVQLQLVRGGTTVVLASTTTPLTFAGPIQLQAGDVVRWQVTGVVAASTFDATINGVFSTLAGAAPASVNLSVVELES